MKRMISCTLNGVARRLEISTDATLLEVLRDDLGLHSVRETCGIGSCGACTVLIDGEPMSSCLLLAPLADGHVIETIEALSSDDQLDPLQQAFIDCVGFQCGYCTPGMILSAKALLAENPEPSRDDVAHYLSGNLCRCGSYPRIIDAVLKRSQMTR